MNHKTVARLDRYNEILFKDLTVERRAIKNWARLKVLIAILKTCGYRMDKLEMKIKKKEKKKKTFNDYMFSIMQSPDTKHCRIWQVFASISYTAGYFIDTYLLAFHLMPILSTSLIVITEIRALITLLDVVFTFFTAVPKEIRITLNDSHDDPSIRKRERQGNNIQTAIPGLRQTQKGKA